jgi:antitoxin component of MazEF toxin-antitoxin module
MGTVTQIQKLGDNLGVFIPQVIVNKLSLREGFYVNIQGNRNRIIIETIKSGSSYSLSDMLNKITEKNIQQSIDTGEPVGWHAEHGT